MEAAGREAVIGVTEAEPNSSPELILLVSSLIGSLQHVLHYHLLNDAFLTQTRGQKIHTVASGSVDVSIDYMNLVKWQFYETLPLWRTAILYRSLSGSSVV